MDAQGINAELRECYERFRPEIEKSIPVIPGISHPHLISVTKEYVGAPIRMLAVGMQTRGWFDEQADEPAPCVLPKYNGRIHIKELMQLHEWFMQPQNRRDYKRKGFWPFVFKAESLINRRYEEAAVLWSNLVKIELNEQKPPDHIADKIGQVCLLREEIRVTKPHIAIFFTGLTEYYENRLRQSFPGVVYKSVPEFEPGLVAVLDHPDLPRLSIRTAHPRTLDSSGRKAEVLQKIVRLAREEVV